MDSPASRGMFLFYSLNLVMVGIASIAASKITRTRIGTFLVIANAFLLGVLMLEIFR